MVSPVTSLYCPPSYRTEKTGMAILLHNLLARAPKLSDLGAVTKLLIAEDIAQDGMSDYTEEDLLANWHRSGFNMDADAWIVVTNKGQYVGYADVWSSDYAQIEMRVRVHPAYRGRGIGTFLLRLAEMRARQHANRACPGVRVTLYCAINATNLTAKSLLDHEGYELVRHFWRMMVTSEEPVNGSSQAATLKLDLLVNTQKLTGLAQRQPRTGIYVARQYDVYEKELRAGKVRRLDNVLDVQSVGA